MKLTVVAVYDTAVQAYGRPIFVPAVGVAVRSFNDEVNRKVADNQMNAHPEDFALFHLADFDEETGKFIEVEQRCLSRGKDVVQP